MIPLSMVFKYWSSAFYSSKNNILCVLYLVEETTLQAEPTKNANGKDIIVTATATMGKKPDQAAKRNPTAASRPKKTKAKTKKAKPIKKMKSVESLAQKFIAIPQKAFSPTKKVAAAPSKKQGKSAKDDAKAKKTKKNASKDLKFETLKEVTGTRYAKKPKKVKRILFFYLIQGIPEILDGAGSAIFREPITR